MRYKVHAPSDADYEALLVAFDADPKVEVHAFSRRRCLISTGDLSPAWVQRVRDLGGAVTEDVPYDPEDG